MVNQLGHIAHGDVRYLPYTVSYEGAAFMQRIVESLPTPAVRQLFHLAISTAANALKRNRPLNTDDLRGLVALLYGERFVKRIDGGAPCAK
jgi:hypothetical protein